ncbi:hypothetical protein Hdeb2414_s0006g00196451 [Helianthus debilis subsp. tardiflorus]
MSMLWAPQNPGGFSIFGYQGKVGYSLMNVFDPKAGGAMVVDLAEQSEARKKRKRDKSEKKKDEEPVTEDKKKELDAQVAAALVEKKSKLQKDTATAPSESEIDLGVFSAKAGNLLEKMYKSASGSRAPKSCKSARKVDISKITPPESPLSRPLYLSPPHPNTRGKEKEDEVEQVKNVAEDVAAGAGGGEAFVEGAETEVDSSEATPQQGTIYTKRVRDSGEGGASETRRSPEYQHVQGGSWDTGNPACDDLPHAPRWNLTQGFRMNDIANCQEFYSLSLPLRKESFRKNATGWIFWMIIFISVLIFTLLARRL